MVNETDLCYLGGIPGEGLREVFGVREEESQSYFPNESVGIKMADGNLLGLNKNYKAVDTCSLIHAEGAEVLATYADQYFAGSPALTVNSCGKGKAYYIAARSEAALLSDLYGKLIPVMSLERVIDVDLPTGVTAQVRTDGRTKYIFLMNFNARQETLDLDAIYTELLTGKTVGRTVTLGRYGVMVLTKP